MVSETSLVAANARLNEWALEVRDCRNRPRGMKVEEWCSQRGLTKAGYYYHLRRVRKAMLDVMNDDPVPEFVEIDLEASEPAPCTATAEPTTTVATIQVGCSAAIQISELASEEFLGKLLRAVQSC